MTPARERYNLEEIRNLLIPAKYMHCPHCGEEGECKEKS